MTTNYHTPIAYKAKVDSSIVNSPIGQLDNVLSGGTPITSIDINGGTIDGTSIGSTTAGTGSFTNLTVSGTTTGVTLPISSVTNLQTTLDGKASSSHTHAISNVTNLQTALDGKASSVHTHGASDVASGVLDNARVNWASPSAIGATTASTLRGTTLSLTSTNNVLSNLIPSTTATYDLGSSSNRWDDVFASKINISNSSSATSGTFQISSMTSTFNPATDYTQIPIIELKEFTLSASGNQLTAGTVQASRTILKKTGSGTNTNIFNSVIRNELSAGSVNYMRGLEIENVISGGTVSGVVGGIGVNTPTYSGTPTIANAFGITIENQGHASVGVATGLYIADQTGATSNYSIYTEGGTALFNVLQGAYNFIVRSDTNANMLRVDGTNNRVYIGASSGSRTFEVNGTLGSLTTYSTTVGATNRALYVDNTGLIGYVVSRAGAKNSILTLSNEEGLFDKLNALRPVSFYYNNDMSGQRRYGLIAEEVDAVNPHWVSYDEVYTTDEETGEQTPTGELVPATVNYNELIAVLIAGYQHLQARIAVLEGA